MGLTRDVQNGDAEGIAPFGQTDRIETIARAFHEEYERRAPEHGWETQRRARVAWEDLPGENRRLMIATVSALIRRGVIRPPD